MKSRTAHRLRRYAWVAVILYGLLGLFSFFVADSLIFAPPSHPNYQADGTTLQLLDTPQGGQLAVLHLPAAPGKPTVLYSHGNAENLAHSLPLYEAWNHRGWGVFVYDYPGYGLSSGKPSETSVEKAAEVAWNHLTTEWGVADRDVLLIGRSVGSGPATWLATRHPAAALILISPFTSTFEVLPPAQWIFPGNRFPNLRRIRHCELPLLVIHGTADDAIPPSHGLALYQASPATHKLWLPLEGADHNNLFDRESDRIFQSIQDFTGR
ncbi:hypothetical protein HNR46_001538 [Haloferula luteola]|uniref:Serine aminopeptidase S33 domain-containing protein n=1 Tax=Haloferula luteola TaxID=595692 RepID=A0A840UZV8_9BACT|nr:alpha/beta hydrolase [Haloferula luteola]MBB5351302.1 hypothetical protein [Haloferula luteola]